jgi:LPXTG-motif cell wall-anchored protein
MIAKAAAGVVLGLIVAAMVLVGVSFAGFAIFTALQVPTGLAGAAALTALILLIGPLLFIFIASLFRPRRQDFIGDAFLANLFTGIVRDRPLLAMLGAGLIGAAGIFLRKKR